MVFIDIVQVLTQQANYQTARKYWNKLKQRLSNEGSQLVTDCNRLKMTATDRKQRLEKKGRQSVTNYHRLKLPAADGKNYLTDVATAEILPRLVLCTWPQNRGNKAMASLTSYVE